MTPFTDGACRDAEPDAFFPKPSDHEAIRAAKVICHTCPVQAACLELAMANEFGGKNARDGIYGGTTASERAKMHRRPRPVSHGTNGGYRAHQRHGETPCAACKTAARLARAESRRRGAA